MNLLRSTCTVLFVALLAVWGVGHVAAQSYWNLGAAPAELASHGDALHMQILDDKGAYDVAELDAPARRRSAPSAAAPPAAAPAAPVRRERTAQAASRRIDLYVDLAHYSRENLHKEAVAGSRNNGIVVVAFTDEKEARDMHHIVADHVRAGALIRSVMRAAPEAGMRFDIYYNGISLFRSKQSSRPPVGSLEAELKPVVELQSIDIRMAEKQKEIDELERKLEAMDRAFELGDDPGINK